MLAILPLANKLGRVRINLAWAVAAPEMARMEKIRR